LDRSALDLDSIVRATQALRTQIAPLAQFVPSGRSKLSWPSSLKSLHRSDLPFGTVLSIEIGIFLRDNLR